MTVEEALRAIAGTFILVSLALGYFVNPWWFLFTAFVGANLLQSAFTRWCPMMPILHKLGVRDARMQGGPHDLTAQRH
jgi:hypothetical protein